MRPAIFLDRDGTLIEDLGHLKCPSQVKFFPETFASLRRLAKRFGLFMVTNQPGVADGLLTMAEVNRVNRYVADQLARAGVDLLGTYVCPHRRDQACRCIKPNPYHLYRAAETYGLDLCRSFVIGDHPHDVELAVRSGGRGVYVLTGHGARHRQEIPAGAVVTEGIGAAVEAILTAQEPPGACDWRQQAALAGMIIHQGGVVAFPTETVYGLGAGAFNPSAVARVFRIKKRPSFDPLIVHIARHRDLLLLVDDIPEAARSLMSHFWPGPLTIVLPKRPTVPDIVTAGLATVAVRMPDHPVALELIRRARTPIAAPSANPFGRISPTRAEHVREQLSRQPDLVLDAGPCRVGVESTVVSFCAGRPVILRPGGVPREDIESVIGPVERTSESIGLEQSPGTLPCHYAPRTTLVLSRPAIDRVEGQRIGRLCFRPPTCGSTDAATEVLSASGDLTEAAANLFAALRRLDAMNLDLICAELVPETGLGVAINDRLRRASST